MTVAIDGAWTRRWVRLEGGPAFETQHVVWLQAGAAYADIRVPFHVSAAARCFTGTSGWDGGRYRWTHHLDLEGIDGPAADDIGDLQWERDVLLERGMFPTADGAVGYEEAWVRLPGSGGPASGTSTDRSTEVRVGDHAITVVDERPHGPFTATYRRRGAAVLEVSA